MPTWTCNNFKGHNPVGVGAVVSAPNKKEAIAKLESELRCHFLDQKIQPEQLELLLIPSKGSYAVILADGEY